MRLDGEANVIPPWFKNTTYSYWCRSMEYLSAIYYLFWDTPGVWMKRWRSSVDRGTCHRLLGEVNTIFYSFLKDEACCLLS